MSVDGYLLTRGGVIEIITSFIKKHRVNVCCISGTAMLMYNLRNGTRDINLIVSKEDYVKLKASKKFKEKTITNALGTSKVLYDSVFEIFTTHKLVGVSEVFEDVKDQDDVYYFVMQHPSSILKFKETLNREKDKADIVVLKDYLE